MEYRFGVDIGGTFTDIVLLGSDGSMRRNKVASTPEDYGLGIVQGLSEMLAEAGIDPALVRDIAHGTTVVTNTVLEGKGARTALITTAGFRDVLEMRRLRIPVLYDLQYTPPPPLVPRRLRFEVEERVGPTGQVWRALDEETVRRAGEQIAASGVEAVAIALIHAYANRDHERRVRDIIAPMLPAGTYITLSSDVLPEIREYERTSTTVVNAYVGPVARHYLATLLDRLRGIKLTAPLQIMQSSGGVMNAEDAVLRPAYILESGPAAGVIASAAIMPALGLKNAVSFDMGGTTAKAALIENGAPVTTTEYEVGAGINISSKLVKGGGHAVKLPIIDISEIGAGGGSVVTVDALGSLKVGPRSAGSRPGPACYGMGGLEPTFTDAMLELGYVNPVALAGGRVRLHAELAHRAIADQVAAPLGIEPMEAAWGTYVLAVATMTRAVKAVSTYRGRDPRDFALIAFGGNGPVAAVAVARALQMNRVIVPPAPGVFSAAGLLFTDSEQLASRTVFRRMHTLQADDLHRLQRELEDEVRQALARGGATEMTFQHFADLRYSGQAYELTVPLDIAGPPVELAARFHAEHARTYGHSSEGDPVDLMTLKVVGKVVAARAETSVLSRLADDAERKERRRFAYFGPELGRHETPVLPRSALSATPRRGPLIIEEYDATCVVPPDATVMLDGQGNIDIRLELSALTARLDPITFEVISSALSSIADEMALVIMRSAYSAVVRDSMDYSTGLCDRNGEMIAQGLTLAVQLGAFPDAMRHLIDQFGHDMNPGDVFVYNDPYGAGGQHLPDIYVIKPIFCEGKLEGYAATMAHHSDVGGIAPGSTAIHASEIFQEGLRLPIVKLYDAGVPHDAVFRIIERNTRQPIQVLGDLKAQVAACSAGERGLLDILRRHGAEGLRPYLEELQSRAERMMRAEISKLPDGEYSFTDYIDGVGDPPDPLIIQVRVQIAGDEVIVDLTGTSAQVPAAINCPIAMVNSVSYCAIRAVIGVEIPNCQGYMKPVKVIAPEGTLVNPVLPAACAARGLIGYRVFDAIMGALAQIMPEKVIAGCEGGPTLFSIGGYHEGRAFVLTEVMVGTWGARHSRDGVEGISNPAANLSNQPAELIEAELPLELVHYALVPDSGGPGRQRGGLGFTRAWRLLGEQAVFTTRSDRRDHPPYGLAGGHPGGPSMNTLISGDKREKLPPMPMAALPVKRGDMFLHVCAGGGGFGDPLERDPALVLEDVIDGKVSREAALRDYGVRIDASLNLDVAGTTELRTSRRS